MALSPSSKVMPLPVGFLVPDKAEGIAASKVSLRALTAPMGGCTHPSSSTGVAFLSVGLLEDFCWGVAAANGVPNSLFGLRAGVLALALESGSAHLTGVTVSDALAGLKSLEMLSGGPRGAGLNVNALGGSACTTGVQDVGHTMRYTKRR